MKKNVQAKEYHEKSCAHLTFAESMPSVMLGGNVHPGYVPFTK